MAWSRSVSIEVSVFLQPGDMGVELFDQPLALRVAAAIVFRHDHFDNLAAPANELAECAGVVIG